MKGRNNYMTYCKSDGTYPVAALLNVDARWWLGWRKEVAQTCGNMPVTASRPVTVFPNMRFSGGHLDHGKTGCLVTGWLVAGRRGNKYCWQMLPNVFDRRELLENPPVHHLMPKEKSFLCMKQVFYQRIIASLLAIHRNLHVYITSRWIHISSASPSDCQSY